MKYCLSVNKDTKLDGYTTIVIQTRMVGFEQINSKIEDAYATDIIAEDVLPFFELAKQEFILDTMSKKLRKGGRLVVGLLDVDILAEAVKDAPSIEHVNQLIYGGDPSMKSVFDASIAKQILEKNQLTVRSVRFDGPKVLITAVKE